METQPTTFGECIEELDLHISIFADKVQEAGENVSALEVRQRKINKRGNEQKRITIEHRLRAARAMQSKWAGNLGSCSILRQVLVSYAGGDPSTPIERLVEVEDYMTSDSSFFEFAVQHVAEAAEALDVVNPPPVHRVFLLARTRLARTLEDLDRPPESRHSIEALIDAVDVHCDDERTELDEYTLGLEEQDSFIETLKLGSEERREAESIRNGIAHSVRARAFRLTMFTFAKHVIYSYVAQLRIPLTADLSLLSDLDTYMIQEKSLFSVAEELTIQANKDDALSLGFATHRVFREAREYLSMLYENLCDVSKSD